MSAPSPPTRWPEFAFSGLESDQFVALAKRLLEAGAEAPVEIRGRDPITSTPTVIVGRPVEITDRGYARTLSVRTDRGYFFKVGGTNTTKSIASEEVVFRDVPLDVVPDVATPDSFERWVEELRSESSDAVVRALDALTFGRRSGEGADWDALHEELPRLIESSSEAVRLRALALIGLLGGMRALPLLSSRLGDPSPLVRRQAALRLRALDAVIADHREHPDAQACIDALARLLREDPEPDVRIYAAEDLGYFYDEAAIEALRGAIESDECTEVRWAAIVALSRTNAADAISVLLGVLERETDPSTLRAALLGIGRHAPGVLLRDAAEARRVADSLARWIAGFDRAGVDYAIYALGEFGREAASHIDLLLQSMESEDIQVVAPAVMSLSKLLPHGGTEEVRRAVLQRIRDRLGMPQPAEWPDHGFFRTFLAVAGDLALTLEDFELSREVYGLAARLPDQEEWLRLFYEGAALHAGAEAVLASTGSLRRARHMLDDALERFRAIESLDAFARADTAKSGLRLKLILAEARLELMAGLDEWPPRVGSLRDVARVRPHVERADELYANLDIDMLGEDEGRLSAQEVALVTSLQLAVGTLQKLCLLAEALLRQDGPALRIALEEVRWWGEGFVEQVGRTQSVSLANVRDRVSPLIVADESAQRSEGAQARDLIERLPRAFVAPAPVPGNCPVVRFGEASLTIKVPDSISGSGTQDDPYVVPANKRLVFDGTVYVHQRAKDETLAVTAAGRQLFELDREQDVPVFESSSSYRLRPIEAEPMAPSSVPIPYTFELSFSVRGCPHVAALVELWVIVAESDGAAGAPRKASRTREEVEGDIRETEARLAELPSTGSSATYERRRRFERELDALRQELGGLEER